MYVLSNCSSSDGEQSQLAVVDLQLFLVEIALIFVVLLVTVAKRLCFDSEKSDVPHTSSADVATAIETP